MAGESFTLPDAPFINTTTGMGGGWVPVPISISIKIDVPATKKGETVERMIRAQEFLYGMLGRKQGRCLLQLGNETFQLAMIKMSVSVVILQSA
jgi:hypothetical protein